MPIDKLRLRLSTSARRLAGTDYVFKVFARQALLVHMENYCVRRVLRVGCVVAGLININQSRPHVEPAPSGVSFAGVPQRRHVF